MQKRLETDLMSLAHSILKMKNKEDVFALKEKSQEIYEKLSLLAFVEEYINTTPNTEQTKEELLSKIEKAKVVASTKKKVKVDKVIKEQAVVEEKVVDKMADPLEEVKEVVVDKIDKKEVAEVKVEEIIEQPFDELEELLGAKKEIKPATTSNKKKKEISVAKAITLDEELKDTISVDEMTTLFDIPAPKSLNDRLTTNLKIDLNDRIAFVKNLFDGSQEDFNRVVSQLNTYSSEKEAKKFITKIVKPDYDWSDKEELEARFIEILARKFA
ncbi:hypothetical protein [uncultured Polaribacter sp.]|uniref:hypothetical protein n=1 Tax=uncultured Polaribacter sp. TaxID=174711 RepID=UPI00262A3C56|nr:hypothetical protein [uncultured Polaribacter sp.]